MITAAGPACPEFSSAPRAGSRVVSILLPIPLVQALQAATVLGAAPGVSGVIAKAEARMQGRTGPRILQPYSDLRKLFRKEALAPEGSSWVFLAAPLGAMTCYLTVPLLYRS